MAVEETVLVRCDCGKKLKAPAASVGKRARCPACGNTLVLNPAAELIGIPTVAAVAPVARSSSAARSSTATMDRPAVARSTVKTPAPATVPADEDDPFGAMYELAEQAKSAEPAAHAARCPQCRSAFADGAVICTNCGYDTRTGRAPSTAAIVDTNKPALNYASVKKPKDAVDLMAPQGSFLVGLTVSAVFALGASVLWFVMAIVTGFVIGYVAIAIGVAAGLGMRIGQKGFSSAGGMAAAGMTAVAILAAKMALFQLILVPAHSHYTTSGGEMALYFFRPISLIIMVIGMSAAFRTANGSVSN